MALRMTHRQLGDQCQVGLGNRLRLHLGQDTLA